MVIIWCPPYVDDLSKALQTYISMVIWEIETRPYLLMLCLLAEIEKLARLKIKQTLS